MEVLMRWTWPLFTLAAACVPDVDVDESVVTTPRLVAIRAEPAEAAPGAAVAYQALYVDRDGAVSEAALDWAYCVARRPLAELGPVSSRCVAGAPEALVALGTGLEIEATIPQDACRLFGPDVPPATPGSPGGRPADPDPTGGYAQPLRVGLPSDAATPSSFFSHRIRCGLPGATSSQAAEFRQRYRVNNNPSIASLTLQRADGSVETLEANGDRAVLERSEEVVITVAWAACPAKDTCGDGICGGEEETSSCPDDCTTPVGCGGAESYALFTGDQIVARREAIRVSWLATAPGFALERTGIAGDDPTRESSNTFRVPSTSGNVVGWVVLRDDRGGAAWRSFHVEVP